MIPANHNPLNRVNKTREVGDFTESNQIWEQDVREKGGSVCASSSLFPQSAQISSKWVLHWLNYEKVKGSFVFFFFFSHLFNMFLWLGNVMSRRATGNHLSHPNRLWFMAKWPNQFVGELFIPDVSSEQALYGQKLSTCLVAAVMNSTPSPFCKSSLIYQRNGSQSNWPAKLAVTRTLAVILQAGWCWKTLGGAIYTYYDVSGTHWG